MSMRVGGILVYDEVASTPASPAVGKKLAYAKTDGFSYWKNSAGSEFQVVTDSQVQTLTNKSFGDTPFAANGIFLRIPNGKAETDLPNSYPTGSTITKAQVANGWPADGLAITQIYETNAWGSQILISSSQLRVRAVANATTWHPWITQMNLANDQTVVAATKTFDANSMLRLLNVNDVASATPGPATFDHAFQVGPDNAAHIAIDSNEIMARGAGGILANLNLQNDGGNVNMGGGLAVSDMRTKGDRDTSSRTTGATTSFGLNGITAEVSLPWPASGGIEISVSARLNNATAVAGDAAILGWEIRTASGTGGSQRVIAGDTESAILRNQAQPSAASRTVYVNSTLVTALGGTLPAAGDVVFVHPMLRTNNTGNLATAQQIWIVVRPSL